MALEQLSVAMALKRIFTSRPILNNVVTFRHRKFRKLVRKCAQNTTHAHVDAVCTSSVSIPGRVFLFPGIREWQFSFPGARE